MAAEGDPAFAETIIESAGIILPNSGDLSTCYDERGKLHSVSCLPISRNICWALSHSAGASDS